MFKEKIRKKRTLRALVFAEFGKGVFMPRADVS